MPRGRPRKVEQGNVAEVPKEAPQTPAEPAKPDAGTTLDALLEWAQEAKFKDGVVVTRISHPDAQERIYPGKYSGFHLVRGPIGCAWSDGSVHPPDAN